MEQKLSETSRFKRWLKGHLRLGAVTVTFTKKDGSERVMLCTTSTDIVPQEPIHVTNTDNPVDFPIAKKERKVNEEVMPVYDIEAGTWKSFRWDSISQVTFKI